MALFVSSGNAYLHEKVSSFWCVRYANGEVKSQKSKVKYLTWSARIATLAMNNDVVIFICSKVLAIWHNKFLFCSLNEISTERNSHKSPVVTQRYRITSQATKSARSSQLLETLRERHNWLVIY